jgi:hypothetical protein
MGSERRFFMKWSRMALLAGLGLAGSAMMAGAVRGQDAQFDLPDGKGKDQVMVYCTTCHAISIVTAQRKSTQQWGDTVEMMMSRGAQVTEEDYPVVVEYLGANFSEQASGKAPTVATMAPTGAAATKTP